VHLGRPDEDRSMKNAGVGRRPVAAPKVAGTARARAQRDVAVEPQAEATLPPLPKATPPAKKSVAVDALKALGINEKHARENIALALARAPVVTTSAPLEDACARFAAGEIDAAALADIAIKDGTERVLLPALRDYAPEKLEGVRQALVSALLRRAPTTTTASVERAALTAELLSLDRWTNNSFSANFLFTNEPGLPAAAKGMTASGGAAIGVSGGLLDIACATRSDAVVIVDVDPSVVGFIVGLNAILLALDDVEPKLSGDERVARIRAVIAHEEPLLPLLARSGVPVDRLATAQAAFRSIRPKQPLPRDTWLDGHDAAQNVMHLTKLARGGRLLGIRADWADPLLGERLKKVLDELGVSVGAVNFSNMLDYTVDDTTLKKNLSALPQQGDAQVMMNSFYRRSSGVEPFPFIGTFAAPVASALTGWTDGRGFDDLRRYKSGEGEYRGTRPLEGGEAALEELRQKGAEARARLFSPERRSETLKNYLHDLGRLASMLFLDKAAWEEALARVAPDVTSQDALAPAAARVEALFWTEARLARYVDVVCKDQASIERGERSGGDREARALSNADAARKEIGALLASARTPDDVEMLVGLWLSKNEARS
jgi:hypothetical protein